MRKMSLLSILFCGFLSGCCLQQQMISTFIIDGNTGIKCVLINNPESTYSKLAEITNMNDFDITIKCMYSQRTTDWVRNIKVKDKIIVTASIYKHFIVINDKGKEIGYIMFK